MRSNRDDEVLLVHNNPEVVLMLTCDTSPIGIGSVLQRRAHDGTVHPIAFISHTSSQVENNYAQIEHEGLDIVFGTEEFRHYLLSHQFIFGTDHKPKPLLLLFGKHKGIPKMISARITLWARKLPGKCISYKIENISPTECARAFF